MSEELTRKIYCTLEDIFPRATEPRGIEITYHGGKVQRIYTWDLARNIARKIEGLQVEKAPGDTWEDAQRRA